MSSSTLAPAARIASNNSSWVPIPAPRESRLDVARSNTATSHPARRSRLPANSPATEPPTTIADRLPCFTRLLSLAAGRETDSGRLCSRRLRDQHLAPGRRHENLVEVDSADRRGLSERFDDAPHGATGDTDRLAGPVRQYADAERPHGLGDG